MNHTSVSVMSGKIIMEVEDEVEIECNHCHKTDKYFVCIEVEDEDLMSDRD